MSSDDKDQSLLQLSRHYRASIVSQLVNIGSKYNQREHVKFRPFISSLRYLQPKGSELRRRSINAFCQQQYVALSYTWIPPEHKTPEAGRIQQQNY
ncbi:hypothetical protein COL922a_012829 [Colletotrichum nupharicola]|nr:hypothetical protein COL922a_012829 [Colletotrichum nupharicola]